MKYIVSLTATLLISLPVFAQDEPESVSSQALIANQDLSHQQVNQLYQDLDVDQVNTAQDQCQNSYRDQGVDAIGCELDTDKDGIFDHNDQCPQTPINRPVNFLGCEADTDKDGVLDSQDRCPLTPLGTFVDSNGCKGQKDSDQDGVVDGRDQCPQTPLGDKVNQAGCTLQASVLVNIIFDTASYEIREDQKTHLNQDIDTLRKLNDNEIIVITGHTDDRASVAYNETLSWNRANSVKNYLIKHSNVPANKIYILGAGELQPIASNDTEQGRQQNRRIHLEVINKQDLPANVRLTFVGDTK